MLTKNLSGPKMIFFNSLSSFMACSTAGALNAFLMRKTELKTGIDVLDEDLKSYGKSQACAKIAVTQTAISRYLLAVPIIFPGLAMLLIEKMNMVPKVKPLRVTLELTLVAMELYLAVPLGIAYYPQY